MRSLRFQVFLSVMICISGPILLMLFLSFAYYSEKSEILFHDYFHEEPTRLLEKERAIFSNLSKFRLPREIQFLLARCASVKECTQILKITNSKLSNELFQGSIQFRFQGTSLPGGALQILNGRNP